MNIEITKTVTESVQVKFPMYVETNFGYCKWALLSENKCICVGNWGNDMRKAVDTTQVTPNQRFVTDWKQITEKEFCDFYKQTACEIYDTCASFLDSIDEKNHEAGVSFEDPAMDEIENERRMA
jgi:hypothetical protein